MPGHGYLSEQVYDDNDDVDEVVYSSAKMCWQVVIFSQLPAA